MVKVAASTLLLLRRAYSNGRVQQEATLASTRPREGAPVALANKQASPVAASPEEGKQVFWMRDPNTGNWIPENHFDDIDVAEVRQKLLSKRAAS